MKTILYMAMSMNGFVATKDDDTPWSKEVWKSYYKISKSFKALIIGRRTYEIMKSVNEFKKIGNPFTVVVTRKKLKSSRFEFASSPKKAIEIMKKKGFTKVFLGGGGAVNASFLKERLIDEIIIDVEPVVFDKGISLFAGYGFNAKLTLLGTRKLSKNIIQLHYKVRK